MILRLPRARVHALEGFLQERIIRSMRHPMLLAQLPQVRLRGYLDGLSIEIRRRERESAGSLMASAETPLTDHLCPTF